MKKTWNWLGGGVFALVVAGALGFGATQALANSTARACVGAPGEIGVCYDNEECQQMCKDAGHFGGECKYNCCTCIVPL